MALPIPSADALILEALRELHAGRIAAGASLYRRALDAADLATVPFVRHIRMLEGSGHAGGAMAVTREALRAGADLAPRASEPGRDPREAAAEYEALFARGIANAQMMANYMSALSRAGDAERLAAVAAPELLFRRVELPVSGDREAYLARLTSALLNARTREFQEATKSLRQMERVLKTHQHDHPDVRALHRSVRALIRDYIDRVAGSSHRIAPWLSPDFHLHSWGVISEGGGHSAPHIHAGCWVVAVAYIAGAEREDGAGSLEIGASLDGDAQCGGWPRLRIAPIPGTVVIMPAFYTHWTRPLDGSGLRISVAFNAAEKVSY